MYIVSQTKHTKTILEEGKGRWGGEENVDAVSSVSQPLCQLFNLWLKLKSLALAPELTSLKQKRNAVPKEPLWFLVWSLMCGGEYGLSWATHAYNTNRQPPLTNYCLGLCPIVLLQGRFCFTRVLNFKWYTTKSARVVFCELFCGICIFVSLQLFLLWIQIYMILYYLYVWMELLKWDYSYFLCVQSLLL